MSRMTARHSPGFDLLSTEMSAQGSGDVAKHKGGLANERMARADLRGVDLHRKYRAQYENCGVTRHIRPTVSSARSRQDSSAALHHRSTQLRNIPAVSLAATAPVTMRHNGEDPIVPPGGRITGKLRPSPPYRVAYLVQTSKMRPIPANLN